MRARDRILNSVTLLVLVAILFFLWPTRLGGATTFVVVRGSSMEPKYHSGDLLIAREQDQYDVGDIVIFRVPSGGGQGALVVHRLTEVGDDGAIVTQGDNREHPDGFTLHLGDIVGEPIVNIPLGGKLLVIFSTWWFLALVAGVLMVWRLWPEESATESAEPERADESSASTDDLEWFTSVMGGDVLDAACDFELWPGDLDVDTASVEELVRN
jgi:signal peptidase